MAPTGEPVHVKSLEIHGFKSFVDRVAFGFEDGITAIVGPNGCGKSNVVDAFRWGMGEQSPRRLRGKGMEDVIFAGSEQRSPVGMAEVVITFDTSDGQAPPAYAAFQEIQIARRLYRSGESEYLINKVPSRLKDVLDFFRDTGIGTRGYAIVEQGRIAEIVSARPEERRGLIEEAAGISKYKARRHEAERKLEGTEQNLLRVSDVLGEIKRQINSLERQARKAARFKRLRETQRLLELSLAHDERAELLAEIENSRRRAAEFSDELAGREAKLGEKEAALEQHRVELAERERIVMSESERLFHLRSQIKELEGRISYGRRERGSLLESSESRGREREQLEKQLRESEEAQARLGDELRAVTAALEADGAAMGVAESEVRGAEEALRAVEAERDAASHTLVEHLTLIARLEDRLAALGDRREEVDRRLRSTDEQVEVHQSEAARVDSDREALEEGLRNLLADRDALMGKLREATNQKSAADTELESARDALRGARELRETRRARLQSLEELIERREDLGSAARHLLEGGSARPGLRGLLRDCVRIEPGYERAVEVVLAGAAEALVADEPASALAAIDSLRAQSAGRGAFVVASGRSEPTPGMVPLGTPLRSHVTPGPGYESLFDRLLRDVNCVDALREVVDVYGAAPPCAFVTRAGDLLTTAGVLQGGAGASEPGALVRIAEVRQLREQVAELDRRVSALEQRCREAEEAAAAASDELDNLRNRHHTAALAVASHEKDLERSRDRLKAIGEAQEDRVAARSSLLEEAGRFDEERERSESQLVASRGERTRRQAMLDGLGVRIGSASREVARLSAIATERRVQQASRAETRDRIAESVDKTGASVLELRTWIGQREEEIQAATNRRSELAEEISRCETELSQRLEQEEAARAEAETKREAFERSSAEVRALEEGAREDRQEVNQSREAAQAAELAVKERELRLTHLAETIRDRWHVDLADWKPPIPAQVAGDASPLPAAEETVARDVASSEGEPGGDALPSDDDVDVQREAARNAELIAAEAPERKRVLEETRRKIESMGEVNLGAIEEHEELRERDRFLSEQKDDLEHSVAQLRDAIARINRTSRKRFRETFDAVNERFEKNFPRLFRGGKASLSLSESEDVLDAGIEIMAQPPGKKNQSVNLLSGGEKTMTALALLVSVFQVRPSPFFLLDEVDAALDDANIGRFNEMLADLADQSQFLLITHNKRTIEVAKTLYGVTMEEKGVSKLVGVELG
jgi:chromosome segregation protein